MSDPELVRVLAHVSALQSLGFYAEHSAASGPELWEILRAGQDRANAAARPWIYEVADPAGYFGFDQETALVRLNAEQRARFEKVLPWKIR